MTRRGDEWTPTEIGEGPEVVALAEAVRDSGVPLLLLRDGVGLAVLVPVDLARRLGLRAPRTEADRQAFLASAGGWKGLVDADKLVADIYQSRGRSDCRSDEE